MVLKKIMQFNHYKFSTLILPPRQDRVKEFKTKSIATARRGKLFLVLTEETGLDRVRDGGGRPCVLPPLGYPNSFSLFCHFAIFGIITEDDLKKMTFPFLLDRLAPIIHVLNFRGRVNYRIYIFLFSYFPLDFIFSP